MKFKIIVDSSSNLLNSNYQDKKDVAFKVVPLTIRIGQEEFIDNDELDVNRMLDVLRLNDGGQSSCPSPNDYLRELDEAEYSFIITITSKLSGSFNSACVARTMCKNPEHVFVIDSKGTAGSIVLIAEKGYSINTIESYKNDLNNFFEFIKKDNINNITLNDLKKYIENLYKQGFSISTLSRNISTLRQFFIFLQLENIITENPAELLELPKKQEKLRASGKIHRRSVYLLSGQSAKIKYKGEYPRQKSMTNDSGDSIM